MLKLFGNLGLTVWQVLGPSVLLFYERPVRKRVVGARNAMSGYKCENYGVTMWMLAYSWMTVAIPFLCLSHFGS